MLGSDPGVQAAQQAVQVLGSLDGHHVLLSAHWHDHPTLVTS